MFSRRWLKYTNERTCNTIASSGFRASVRQPTNRRTTHALHRCLQSFLSEALSTKRCCESPAGQKDIGKRVRGIPALYDLDLRLKVVDSFPITRRCSRSACRWSIGCGGRTSRRRWRSIGNDGLAEVVAKHPDRFVGYSASLPMNAPEAAAKEAERALKNGAHAVQLAHQRQRQADRRQGILAALRGHREIRQADPAASGRARREMPDYRSETKSKYEICSVLGWPFETGVDAVALHLLQDHGHAIRT